MFARILVLGGALAALFSVAVPVRAQLTADEQKCQATAAKSAGKLFKTTLKALKKCNDAIGKGDLPAMTDCTAEAGAVATIGKAETKLNDKIAAACTDALVSALTFGGDCAGVTTVAALQSCLIQTHEDAAIEATAITYDGTGPKTSDEQTCQKAVAGKGRVFSNKRLKLLQKCKNDVNKGTLLPTTDCAAEAGVVSKSNDARLKAETKVTDSCSDATTAALAWGAPCTPSTTGAAIATCSMGRYEETADDLIEVEYGSLGPPETNATAMVITDVADCVGGPLSRCRVGDYLLRNGEIRVVIQALQRNLFGVGEYGGHIIDADLVRAPMDPDRDNFEEWSTSLNIENTDHYTSISVINDGSDGNPAVIRVSGPDDLLDFINASSVVASFGFLLPAATNDTDLTITITTDYILAPGKNWVEVKTTVENTGMSGFSMFFGEYINGSGQVELFQPGIGFGEATVTSACPADAPNPCNFVAYSGEDGGDGVSYGYVHDVAGTTSFTASGVTVPQLGVSVVNALLGLASPNFSLAPAGMSGDEFTVSRYFVVGNGSVSSISDARNEILGIGTGTLSGTVTVGGNPLAGADIAVEGALADGPGSSKNIITHTRTDASGNYSIALAPGNYTVKANRDGYPFEGGGSTPMAHPVSIVYDTTTDLDIALPDTGTLVVTAIDELMNTIPAKASIVGFDPSPDPMNSQTILIVNITAGEFGDRVEDGVGYGLSQVLFLDPTGDCEATDDNTCSVSLEPGNYQVVVSHGPEYTVFTQSVAVTAGMTTTVNAQVGRAVDTTGFVSADFHVHSIQSPDSETTLAERLVSMAAEGVEFFASTDHDNRIDYETTSATIGTSSLVLTTPGEEITTFDYGHFNAWPMDIDPSQVNGGAIDHGGAAMVAGQDFPSYGNFNLTPAQIIADAHADPGTDTVQINHFYDHFGISSFSGLAIDTGLVPPMSAVPPAARRLDPMLSDPMTGYFSATFDALELWIGDDRSQLYHNTLGAQDPLAPVGASSIRGGNIGDWFNLLNQGILATAVADSDTHRRILTQAGTPRNMVASSTDTPAADFMTAMDRAAYAESVSQNVNDGRSIGTNAPMVRMMTLSADVDNSSLALGSTSCLGGGTRPCASDMDGAGITVQVDVQSPIWAPFDTIELYVGTVPTQRTISNVQTGAGTVNVKRYCVAPDMVKSTGAMTLTVTSSDVVLDMAPDRWEATATFSLPNLTQDSWVIAVVRGTDNVSANLFPMVPNDISAAVNPTLMDLVTPQTGDRGITAFAFTNPILIDHNNDGWTAPVTMAPMYSPCML